MANRKSRRANKQKKSRAMPLAIREARLPARPPKPGAKIANSVARGVPHRSSPDAAPAGNEDQSSLAWFPVHLALRQQAVIASAFFNMWRAQQQAAQFWLSPGRGG
jgi:hypothetical protein